MGKKNILQQLKDNCEQDVMTIIYEKVNELLGAGDQLFAMEFPARGLNIKTYEYSVEDSFSSLTKPYPVQEAEFLLSDQMYDIAPVIQGSNGERVSTVYDTVLNNFVPKLEALKTFVKDKQHLRKWLTADVEDEMDGKTRKMSRMGLSKELYGEFLQKRNEWYQKKNEVYDTYKKAGDLDGYAKWLSSEALVQEEMLNNLFNDAVVRGNYHEVLTLLGFLNVSSPAEVLESTKQKMRSSLRRSLDGSTDIYPVQFQPSDWFKSLKPNMSPKDLTMATDSLVAEYRTKQSRLRSLQAQLNEQSIIEVSQEEQDRLKNNIAELQQQVSQADLELMQTYGEGAVSAVKAVIDIYKDTVDPISKAKAAIDLAKTMDDKAEFDKASTLEKKIYNLVGDTAKSITDSMFDTYSKQQKLLERLGNLTQTQAAYAESKVKDMRLQKMRIQEQIDNLQADLDFLKPLVSGTLAEVQKDENVASKDTDVMTTTENDDNSFMDIIIKTEDLANAKDSHSQSSASSSSWNVGGWFWSAGGSRSSSSGSAEEHSELMSKKIEIGFRVRKVSFDRGGWFNPNVFKLSDNYYRLAETRFSKGITKSDVQKLIASAGGASKSDLKSLVTYPGEGDSKGKTLSYVMSAFPTGFVIVKDMTIRIQTTQEEADAARSYMEENASSGGGFLGFGTKSSSSSHNSSESSFFGNTANYTYIRIPGPQILGWFLQFTPADNATPYKELDPEMYTDVLESLVMPEADS